MKPVFLILTLIVQSLISCAQKTDDIFNAKEIERIERTLASDEMQGREAGKPGSEKAAQFIASEFKKAGLLTLNKAADYLQPFKLVQSKFLEVKGEIDDAELDSKKIFVLTTKPYL
jgi:hypothetical protein